MRVRLLTVLLLSTLACKGSDSTAPATSTSAVGTWQLSTLQGSPLPFTALQTSSEKLVVQSASIIISSDGTWSGTESFQYTSSGQTSVITVDGHGSYSMSGFLVTLYDVTQAQTGVATLGQGSLTFPVWYLGSVTTLQNAVFKKN